MAYISFQPTDFFKNFLYTGNGSATSAHTYPDTTAMQPDMFLVKDRETTYPFMLMDSVRGANDYLYTGATNAEATSSTRLKSFDSDGFTIGDDSTINLNANDFASWSWKMGTTSGLSGGTITPIAYSINTTAKQGVYTWAGTGSDETLAHGLGAAPDLMMFKSLGNTSPWAVWCNSLSNTEYLVLNTAAGKGTGGGNMWNDLVPSSTVINLGSDGQTNGSGNDYICYAFCNTKGYFKAGTYTGNGNADGAFVNTGFEPGLIIAKNRDSGGPAAYGWSMISNTFGMTGATSANPSYNELTQNFFADQAVVPGTGNAVDFLSNGFKWRSTGTGGNQSSSPFVYMAWAKYPQVSSNSKAGTAR